MPGNTKKHWDIANGCLKYIISCRGVKLFSTKYSCQQYLFILFSFFLSEFQYFLVLSQFELLGVITIKVVEFCHSLSFWKILNIMLSFVPIQVFELCYDASFFFSFVIILICQFCNNLWFGFWVSVTICVFRFFQSFSLWVLSLF